MPEIKTDLKMADGLITDEALEVLRSRIGLKLRIPNIFNELASKDNIRKFADGIGDPNPLWRDEEYAKKTRYGGIVAPTSFLHSIFPSWVQHGLPGVHGFHSGSDWEIYKPIRVMDKITPECIYTGFKEKKSEFAGRSIQDFEESRYYNQKGELLAKAKVWIFRMERAASRKKGKYSTIQLPHPWKEEGLKKVEEDVLSEEVRGSKIRYWEDVEVGEELKPVVKGPLGLTDMIAFCVGSSPVQLLAHGLALSLYRKHPAWAFRDPTTMALEPIYGVHFNKQAANFAGLPYPYDVGVQRHCWLFHLLTNWMGDDGWIKKCYAEYRLFVYFSDVVWLKGKVVRKFEDEEGEPCVDIETNSYNQRGENVMPGRAIIALPSRKKGTHPLDKRL